MEERGERSRETKKKMRDRELGEKQRRPRNECATEISVTPVRKRGREEERKRVGEGEEGGEVEKLRRLNFCPRDEKSETERK